jgi:hypothetical protein
MRKQKKAQKKTTTQPIQPGPKPGLLKIDSGWEEAVKKSLEKKKPATGWPK